MLDEIKQNCRACSAFRHPYPVHARYGLGNLWRVNFHMVTAQHILLTSTSPSTSICNSNAFLLFKVDECVFTTPFLKPNKRGLRSGHQGGYLHAMLPNKTDSVPQSQQILNTGTASNVIMGNNNGCHTSLVADGA